MPAHIQQYYSWLQDTLFMVFFGFGFLMTFLRKYGYSAVGLNFFLSAFAMVEGVRRAAACVWRAEYQTLHHSNLPPIQSCLTNRTGQPQLTSHHRAPGPASPCAHRNHRPLLINTSCAYPCAPHASIPPPPPSPTTAVLILGAIHHVWHEGLPSIRLDLPIVIESAFCAASAMIAFGAVIGKTTPTELFWLIVCMVRGVFVALVSRVLHGA